MIVKGLKTKYETNRERSTVNFEIFDLPHAENVKNIREETMLLRFSFML